MAELALPMIAVGAAAAGEEGVGSGLDVQLTSVSRFESWPELEEDVGSKA